MEGISPEHMQEVEHWLGLFRYDPPQGLHGTRRGNLISRHTRVDAGQKALEAALATPLQARRAEYTGQQRPLVKAGRDWRWVNAAIAETYPRQRELPVMRLLRAQRLDDAFWRQVYALMVTGGPILLPDLIAFVARLTGPRDIANAEAAARYRSWDRRTNPRTTSEAPPGPP